MALLTRDDIRCQSPLAWTCLAALVAVAVVLWLLGRREAGLGTLASAVGCAALLLPPRERMAALPWRLRALPRRLDAAPVLAALLSSPGYGLGWFYGANLYDEAVHLASGVLLGAVLAALLLADGRPRAPWRVVGPVTLAGIGIGAAWEVFEWASGLIGGPSDTVWDVVLTGLGAGIGAAAWRGLAAGRRRPAASEGPSRRVGPGPAAQG